MLTLSIFSLSCSIVVAPIILLVINGCWLTNAKDNWAREILCFFAILKYSSTANDDNFPVYPGPGNKFLVIHVTYVNSDNEARVLVGGEVVVRVDDKEFLFDAPEVVFAEGYIAFDSLNPMVTRKGNVVFKVSEGLKGEIFYRPARSTELIKLN